MSKHFKSLCVAFISVAIASSVATGTIYAATTISTDILTGGTLTVSGLSLLNGNASTTQLSALAGLFVGSIATTTILGDSGTSTFSGGINLGSGGCFAIGGTCVGLGSGTVNTGTLGYTAYYAAGGTAVSGTSTLFIATNQNVGVGTTTPGTLLSVGGTGAGINFTSATSSFSTTGGINLANGCFAIRGTCLSSGGSGLTSLNGLTGSSQTFATTTDANVMISVTSSGSVHTFAPGWTGTLSIARGGTALSSAPTYGQLLLGQTGGTYALTATSSLGLGSGTVNTGTLGYTAYYAAGGTAVSGTSTLFIATNQNVGVGTTTPAYTFSVAGTIYSGSGGIRFPDGSTQTAAASSANSGTAGQAAYYAAGGTTLSGTSTIFITTSQNVGIGTTTPWAKLAIQGAFGNPNTLFEIASSTSANGATTSLFKVDSAGNISIGTSSPGTYQGVLAKVDISSSGHALVNINSALANTAGLNFSENGTAKWGIVSRNTFDVPNNRLAIMTGASAELMTILTTGKVGIGTTTPQWLLQLAASNAPQLTLSDNSSNAFNHWTFRNSGGNLYVATASPATFATSSLTAFAIDTNGNVTIGGNASVNGNLTLANSSTAIGGMVFGYCTITNSASIAATSSGFFNCSTSVTTSAAHRVFVQATSSLSSVLIIQAASSTAAGVINLQIYNVSTTAAAPGAISVNFFGIR